MAVAAHRSAESPRRCWRAADLLALATCTVVCLLLLGPVAAAPPSSVRLNLADDLLEKGWTARCVRWGEQGRRRRCPRACAVGLVRQPGAKPAQACAADVANVGACQACGHVCARACCGKQGSCRSVGHAAPRSGGHTRHCAHLQVLPAVRAPHTTVGHRDACWLRGQLLLHAHGRQVERVQQHAGTGRHC